ncbi:MAG: WYL domain-containing protein [Planctomycetes bacterium]|nr:WYL domain-containing protein [Planctomycetota bacterium]
MATFAVSRIRRVRGTNAFFAVPPAFDVNAHIRQSFGIVRGDQPFRVRLHFSRNVAAYIRARVWHPTQRIVDKRDGSLELSFETAGWKELVRWILSWQPDCRVLAPKRLRVRVDEKMRIALGSASARARA